jgi:hypothetical protein
VKNEKLKSERKEIKKYLDQRYRDSGIRTGGLGMKNLSFGGK